MPEILHIAKALLFVPQAPKVLLQKLCHFLNLTSQVLRHTKFGTYSINMQWQILTLNRKQIAITHLNTDPSDFKLILATFT